MKRELICAQCAKEMKPHMRKYDGEWFKFVDGRLKPRVLAVCDQCNTALSAGAEVSCFSCGLDEMPHRPWEGDYLESETKSGGEGK